MFDEIMKYCPFLKQTIENKISEEVEKVRVEKDAKIAELERTVDELTAAILMGGM